MSNVGIVTGRNFWQNLETDEAHDATLRHKGPYREPLPGECFPDDTDRITPRTLNDCTEPARGAPSLFHASPGKLDIDIADIGQRKIGDCYLLSSLGALTQSEAGRAHIR